MAKAEKQPKAPKKINADDYIIDTDFFLQKTQETVPISPSLDSLLGGGLTKASTLIVFGPPKVGKTTTILYICHKLIQNGMTVYYMNVEHRLKPRDIECIEGFNMDRFKIVESKAPVFNEDGSLKSPGVVLTAEDYLNIGHDLLRDKTNIVVVLDSESQLLTENEQLGDMGDLQRAEAGKMMAKFTRKINASISMNHNILISIRHVMANPSGKGKATKEKGSNAGGYQCDVKIEAEWAEPWNAGEKQIGQIIHWRLYTGALAGAVPGAKVESYLRYGSSLDCVKELVEISLQLGIVNLAGSWYKFGEHSAQGYEKFSALLSEKPEIFEEINKQVQEMIGE